MTSGGPGIIEVVPVRIGPVVGVLTPIEGGVLPASRGAAVVENRGPVEEFGYLDNATVFTGSGCPESVKPGMRSAAW